MPAKKKASSDSQTIAAIHEHHFDSAPVMTQLPPNAHSYYVYPQGSDVCAKIFTNEVYKGEALKFALEFAKEIDGTVQC